MNLRIHLMQTQRRMLLLIYQKQQKMSSSLKMDSSTVGNILVV